jgi:adenylate cyclase
VRISIALKIFVIVLAVLLLMAAVAAVSTWEAQKVATRRDRAVEIYVPAYAALARADVRSLEQALAIRRIVIGELAGGADGASRGQLMAQLKTKATEAESELATARRLIDIEIASQSALVDVAALARLGARIEFLQQQSDAQGRQVSATLAQLANSDRTRLLAELDRLEAMRDDVNQRLEQARTDMRDLLKAATVQTQAEQRGVMEISIVVTALASILGIALAAIMTMALVRPVKRLVAGTRAIEAGALDIEIPVTSSDEIGGLTTAFNHMVQELRS